MDEATIPHRKAALRAASLSRREGMSERERAGASARIVAHLAALVAEMPPVCIAGFAPIRSEADVFPFLVTMRANGLRVALPRLSGGGIVFRDWRAGEELVPGIWGIREPREDAPIATPDLVLVPLAGFDAAGNRLGYGKGHYDRALAALKDAGFAPRLVGVAFAVQEVASTPVEPFDVPLDAVVTEEGLRRFERA